MLKDIEQLLGSEGKQLLEHQCKGIPRDLLRLPGPDVVDRVYAA
ncbi:MAG: fructose-bisphosphate aldolase, partial [candidate division NC10 bacterium]|nr:fructose-bisphosphate aldolase [candidate division NC10 bacterium]